MKAAYYVMETTIKKKVVEIDDISDLNNIRSNVELHVHLHGWDKITPAEKREWVTEVTDDDDLLARNPIY